MRTVPSARPIILDCDPGTDDALATLLALASPELAVAAITVCAGNAALSRTLANALALTTLAGSGVPVHAGAARALLGPFPPAWTGHGDDGMAGVRLASGGAAAPSVAADAIRAALRAAGRPMTLVGIAPATNLALALATEPALATNIEEIVLMAGAWGEGNATPSAEFNARCDPEALAMVVAADRPLTFVTLEAGHQCVATPERIAALRSSGPSRCLRAACEILAALPPSARLGHAGTPLYDPLAIAWLVRPALFRPRAVSIEIDCGPGPSRGRTAIDRWGRQPPNARVLELVDAEGFFALLGERLARLP